MPGFRKDVMVALTCSHRAVSTEASEPVKGPLAGIKVQAAAPSGHAPATGVQITALKPNLG